DAPRAAGPCRRWPRTWERPPPRLRRSLTVRRSEVLGDLGLELRARDRADDLADDLAALEDEQGGDRADPEALRDALVRVDVHLGDLEAPLVLGREGLDGRRDLLAGPTPDGPEVDQGGEVRAEDLGVEGLVGHLEDVSARHLA